MVVLVAEPLVHLVHRPQERIRAAQETHQVYLRLKVMMVALVAPETTTAEAEAVTVPLVEMVDRMEELLELAEAVQQIQSQVLQRHTLEAAVAAHFLDRQAAPAGLAEAVMVELLLQDLLEHLTPVVAVVAVVKTLLPAKLVVTAAQES